MLFLILATQNQTGFPLYDKIWYTVHKIHITLSRTDLWMIYLAINKYYDYCKCTIYLQGPYEWFVNHICAHLSLSSCPGMTISSFAVIEANGGGGGGGGKLT